MSERQDDIAEKRRVTIEESLRSAAGGRLWSAQDLEQANTFGTAGAASVFVPGDRFQLGSAQQYIDLGFAGISPDPKKGLIEYLQGTGETLQDYQARTGGLMVSFNADGTATYDPSAYKANYSYDPGPDWFEVAIPALILSVGAAGIGGFLPGTESAFAAGSASVPGFGASATFSATDAAAVSLTSANITEASIAAASLGGVAGAGASEAFFATDVASSGAVQQAVASSASTLTLPSAKGALDVVKTAGTVAGSVGSIVQSASLIDAATNPRSAPAPILATTQPSANPLVLQLGGSDMATKTASTQPAATPAASTFDLMGLLPLAVLVVAVLALSGEIKGE